MNKTNEEHSTPPAAQIKSDWKLLLEKLSYKGIVDNLPFLMFIVILAIVYITSNYRAVETQKALEKEQKNLKELRWKYMDMKTKLMNAQVEARIIRKGAGIGLHPLTLPAYKVEGDSLLNKNSGEN